MRRATRAVRNWWQRSPRSAAPRATVHQLLLTVVPIFLIVQIAVALALELRSVTAYNMQLPERLANLADARAPLLAEPLWQLRYAKLKSFVSEYALDDQVTAVTIIDDTNSVVAYAEGTTAAASTGEIVRELIYVNGNIRASAGRLIVSYADRSFYRHLLTQYQSGFVVGLMAVLTLCIAMHMTVQTLIGRPLSAMLAAIKSLRTESGYRPVALSVSNEFASLADAFNELQEAQAQAKKRLEFQATHDALTGLPNRRPLQARLESLAAGPSRDIALHFVDLDDFKGINDTFGHDAGDQYLIHVAAQLRTCARETDWVARLGGDEFIVIQDGCNGEEGAREFARTLLAAIAVPLEMRGKRIVPRASIGIAVRPSAHPDVAKLPILADIALYAAKQGRTGSITVLSPRLLASHARRKELALALPLAFDRQEFDVWFQGQFNSVTGRLAGLEALVRWHHPTWGMIPPDDFIPLIEQSGASTALARLVFERCCQARIALDNVGMYDLTIAMNVSPHELVDLSFAHEMESIAHAHGVPLSGFEIEITERLLINNVARTLEALAQIRAKGVRIALDDFGNGYSSLSYLRRFPLDRLKIDKSFTREVPENSDDVAILEVIVSLADKLKLEIVAEGVERPEQIEALRALDIDVAQGYLYHSPQPLEGLLAFIRQHDLAATDLRAAS